MGEMSLMSLSLSERERSFVRPEMAETSVSPQSLRDRAVSSVSVESVSSSSPESCTPESTSVSVSCVTSLPPMVRASSSSPPALYSASRASAAEPEFFLSQLSSR